MTKERIIRKIGENKYTLLFLKWLARNIIRVGFIIDVVIIMLGLYVLYTNSINYEYLIRSCIILLAILIYWNIGYSMSMTSYKIKEYGKIRWYILGLLGYKVGAVEFYAQVKMLEVRKRERKQWIARKYSNFLIENLSPRQMYWYIWIMHRLIWLMPWMWLYWLMVILIYIKYVLKIVINGVLDIYLKKNCKIYIDKSNVQAGYGYVQKSYSYIEWILIFPVYRILSYPLYIRSRILNSYWIDLLRIRFVGYFYVTYIFFMGYGELVVYIKNHYIILIIVVYMYFAVIFPLILYLRFPDENKNEYVNHLYPNLEKIVKTYYFKTITIKIFADILVCEIYPYYKCLVYKFMGNYRSVRNFRYCILTNVRGYGLYNYEIRYKVGWPRFIEMPIKPDLVEIGFDAKSDYRNLWKYEKYYHIPMYVWEDLFQSWDIYWIDLLELYWQEGVERYGIMYMDYEYGVYFKQALDLYKVVLFFIFDLQRLNGVKFENEKPFIKNIYKFKYEMAYDNIPLKYEIKKNLKLYRDIIKVSQFIQSKDLLTYQVSYIPRMFARLVSSKYHVYFKPNKLQINDLFVGYVKGEPTPEHEMMYLRHVSKKKQEIDIVEQYYPELKVSLFDRIELDCPNYWGVFINRGLPGDLIKNFKEAGEQAGDSFIEDLTKIKEYKTFIQEDYVRAVWEEYNFKVKGLKEMKSIDITKEAICRYKEQYFITDKEDFNLMYNDILLVFDEEDIVNDDE